MEEDAAIAEALRRDLQSIGFTVIGPMLSAGDALRIVECRLAIDAAVLDLNLHGEAAYPVAEALSDRSVPFFFVAAYGTGSIDSAYAEVPILHKPVDAARLAKALLPPLKG